MAKPAETCEKINCSLLPNHDGWHVKKAARGKIVISWLNGEWKSPDGQHGTYRYQEPKQPWWERALDQLHANDAADAREEASNGQTSA